MMTAKFCVGKIYKRKTVSETSSVFILVLDVIGEREQDFVYVKTKYINLSTLKVKINELWQGSWELVKK